MFGIIDASVNYPKLESLVDTRVPSAIQFGGSYRLIDFSLSSLVNSGITNVAIFPSSNYLALLDHIGRGKAWGLDRKKEGLFFLPPRLNTKNDIMLSFSDMREHLEYFNRSLEEYVVVTSGIIIWNINFSDVLKDHIEKNATITIIKTKKAKLNTFILTKKFLLELIKKHEFYGYQNLLDVINLAPNISINTHIHSGYTKIIKSVNDLYKANMDILKPEVKASLFRKDTIIRTKGKDNPPSFYFPNVSVENALIASGTKIKGNIKDSVIFNEVVIESGAKVTNSVIMQGARIGENAKVSNCIIDKHGIIGAGIEIQGTPSKPMVIKKDELVFSKSKIRVMHVTTECAPFIKTGGLADVLATLPRYINELGLEIIVSIPLYKQILQKFRDSLILVQTFSLNRMKCRVYTLKREEIDYYFIEIDQFFNRERIYGFDDDLKRYYYFCIAILKLNLNIDILHLHDYHAALIPMLKQIRYKDNNILKKVKIVLTIHNIKYQGEFHDGNFIKKHLSDFTTSNSINFLECGIMYADKITTVSQTHSKEITHQYYSGKLAPIIKKRSADLTGILNGLDPDLFNPENDISIYKRYGINNIADKSFNKTYLQKRCHLNTNLDLPLIGMVSRLTEQKGLDLVMKILGELSTFAQFVLLGTGDEQIENELKKLELKFPDRIKVFIGYDAFNPNLIYAGSDMFLMPSKYEPCGISQMIALKYGSIPIVRSTGGLKDTIINYPKENCNGFSFRKFNASELLYTIKRAIKIYYLKDEWLILIKNALETNFSYRLTALKFVKLYKQMLNKD